MWYGMKKAVTFSYDDGVTQDRRLIKIFDKYGLKATFNLNSGFLGTANSLVREGVTVSHSKPRACEVRNIYKNHEIAAHTLTHPSLPSLRGYRNGISGRRQKLRRKNGENNPESDGNKICEDGIFKSRLRYPRKSVYAFADGSPSRRMGENDIFGRGISPS